MTWFGWFLAAWFLLGNVVSISQIGKPRKPVDTSSAAIGVVISALLIAGLVLVGA